MAWNGYGMSSRLETVNPDTHAMIFSKEQNPESAAALVANTPKEVAARDAALKLSGVAIEYFRDVHNGAHALDAAKDKQLFETFAKSNLADPEQAMLTAKYVEKLQDPDLVGAREEGPLFSLDSSRAMNVPKATFELAKDGTLSEVCFGYEPTSFKGGGNPYTAVCASRDSKE
jgi:hypothetical protein